MRKSPRINWTPNPDAAVRLRVVHGGVLLGYALHGVALYPSTLEALHDERLQGRLIIRLDDKLLMSDPPDGGHDEAGHVEVFTSSFVGNHVSEQDLRLEAPEHDALDDLALLPLLVQGVFSSRVHAEAELLPVHDAAARDKEVIEPDYGDP